MINNDFAVYLHERYNVDKQKMIDNSNKYCELLGNNFEYEEWSCANRMRNVDYDKLFVGARLYLDVAPINKLGAEYEEIEITHLYGGVLFYKQLTGKDASDEEKFLSKDSIAMYIQIYPKIIYKPRAMNLSCCCDKTLILDYTE
ncbi:MAG: hypothetical protein IKO36_00915 [Bacteroidaceae bacterium]|nr:hypothetical protein [Bacteroidaceae bacterium]